MKVVFLVFRTNFYRYFSPLIQEGLNRGYDIECWHDYSASRQGSRWYSFPDSKDAPVFNSGSLLQTKEFYGTLDLEKKLLHANDIDVVICIRTPNYYLSHDFLRLMPSLPFRWVTLMGNPPDSFFELAHLPQEKLDYGINDLFFVFTETWLARGRDYVEKIAPGRARLLESNIRKIKVIGNPEFDAFKEINPQQVRKKYAIPDNKDVLLYLPFPYANRSDSAFEMVFCGLLINTALSEDGAYMHNRKRSLANNLAEKSKCMFRILSDYSAWKYLFSGQNERRVFESVCEFARKNNLYLVAKPRLKFPVSEVIKEKSDLMIWDDEKQQNPPILKELLSVSKLTVSFFSFSILSSIAENVFHLNVALPENFFDGKEGFWCLNKSPSIYNFPGVADNWKIERVIRDLKNFSLNDLVINQKSRADYIKQYIGFDDFCSSRRFFDELLVAIKPKK